jgi:DNA-binding winged helix-turn-helix (wHTH) protein
MDLLVYLARADGRVVSADELLRDVWQGRVFDDGIVYKKITQLRKALGDGFIETIPKRGYRLVVPVMLSDVAAAAARDEIRTPAASGAPDSRNRRRARLAYLAAGLVGIALALALAYSDWSMPATVGLAKKSVVVLPLTATSCG